MILGKTIRAATALAMTAAVGFGGMAATARDAEAADGKSDPPVYFVHGYGKEHAKDCGDTWKNAIKHFEGKDYGGPLKTVGYYDGDTNCDVTLGGGDADTNTRIKNIAKDFANYLYDHHTKKGESVDVVAHSMGGLITRVALLGSAKGWDGFPKKLEVGDVVTLGTPHQGVQCAGTCGGNTQWTSMDPDSEFMDTLDAPENRLDEKWARSTDWTLVGSNDDETVSGDSAIDKDRHADHKLLYRKGGDYKVTHPGIRSFYKGKYNLKYWHADTGKSKTTENGWYPVKTAYQAIAKNGDW